MKHVKISASGILAAIAIFLFVGLVSSCGGGESTQVAAASPDQPSIEQLTDFLYSEMERLGDRLVVAINLDASVRRIKGPARPIQPARTRMEVVAALACVDWVIGFGAPTPIRAIRAVRPNFLAKGGDWMKSEIVGGSDVEGWGGQIVRLKVVPGERTSKTIDRIRANTPRNKR